VVISSVLNGMKLSLIVEHSPFNVDYFSEIEPEHCNFFIVLNLNLLSTTFTLPCQRLQLFAFYLSVENRYSCGTKLFHKFCLIHLHDVIFFHKSNVPLASYGHSYHLR